MTASNHAITGAVIAVVIKQPVMALPIAFLSHFVLDALPHFGSHEDDIPKRNASWLFRAVVSVDVIGFLFLLICIPDLAKQNVLPATVLWSMLAAASPDINWIWQFVQAIRTKKWPASNWYSCFHQAIQWFEKPIGLLVELLWFIAALITFMRLIS